MNIAKKQIIVLTLVVLAIGTISLSRILRNQKKAEYIIGIIQTASHPALDAARQGLVDELNAQLSGKVDYIISNAQGSVSSAQTIAQQMHSNKDIKAIYAIATPALQAIANIEHEKPIIIAAVTDPAAAGIRHTQKNVCGVTDMIDMEKEVQMLRNLLPHVNTVALLYSNAEVNSLKQVEQIKIELAKHSIKAIDVSVIQESDVPAAIQLACRKCDAIIAPTDNIIASSMELVANTALQNKKPLITCYNQAVNQGALASRGVDYYQCGKQAGSYAYQIMVQGKKSHEIGITKPHSDTIIINNKTLQELDLQIPDTLKSESTILK